MKKLTRSTMLALIALLLVVTPVLAASWVITVLDVDTSQCGQVSIDTTFRAISNWRDYNKVKVFIDGVLVAEETGEYRERYVSASFTGNMTPGGHVVKVEGWSWSIFTHYGPPYYQWWGFKLYTTRTETFQVTACNKSGVLISSGVPGEGLLTAPGLDKPFNPLSRAEANAGMPE